MLLYLFKLKITPPPVAVCSISKDSSLMKYPEQYNVAMSETDSWFVNKGAANTLEIRYRRKRFINRIVANMSVSGFRPKLRAILLIVSYFLLPEKSSIYFK
jgi:hypothetical protein